MTIKGVASKAIWLQVLMAQELKPSELALPEANELNAFSSFFSFSIANHWADAEILEREREGVYIVCK